MIQVIYHLEENHPDYHTLNGVPGSVVVNQIKEIIQQKLTPDKVF